MLGADCLAAVKKCNSNDYWIITILKKGTTAYLVVFSLTSSGLAYKSEQVIMSNIFLSDTGGIDIAPNGNKIFVWHPYSSDEPSYIYDFNKAEGIVSSSFSTIKLPKNTGANGQTINYGQIFGSSFSPDSNLLYLNNYFYKKVYQFNINSINPNSTIKEIASFDGEGPWGMQIGPDNKVYVAMSNTVVGISHKLSVIHNPNNLATTQNPNACNFSVNGPIATNSNIRVGPKLPNIIDAKQDTAYFLPNTANVICKYITGCNTYKFFPNVCGTSFVWTFTNTTTGTSVTSTDTNPTYNFAQNGTYIVTVKDNLNTLLGTSSPIIISNVPTAVIDGSTTACLTRANEKITNNSTFINNGETVIWTITGGTGTINGPNNLSSVNISWSVLPGTITLTKVNASGCTSVVTKIITSLCAPLSTQDMIHYGLTISPNPSYGLFTIQSKIKLGKVTISVYDLRGRIVLNQKNFDFNTEKTIDLSSCQSGTYLLKMIGSDFTYSNKLIKN